jgi:hypothetical protein
MKLCWVSPDFSVLNDVRGKLAELGHQIVDECDSKVDAILSWSISQLRKTRNLHAAYHAIPLFSYCWDLYSWVWTRPREEDEAYDYHAYGQILRSSREVWCPSDCTARSVGLFYGPDVRTRVVHTAIPRWEPDDVSDDGYILQPIREQPDPLWGACEAACKKLGLPIVSSNHRLSFDEYRETVARCSFIVSPLWELSTGGLTLLEGRRLGKPSLVMHSPWNGASEYIGIPEGVNFSGVEQFAESMRIMFENRQTFDIDRARRQIDTFYSAEWMADVVIRRITESLGDERKT